MRLSFGNQMTLMSFSWRHEVKHGFSFRGHDQHSHLMKNAAVKFITTDQRSIFRISNLAYALLCELRENTIQFQSDNCSVSLMPFLNKLRLCKQNLKGCEKEYYSRVGCKKEIESQPVFIHCP